MSPVNPFTLEFGVKPPEYIDRYAETTAILEDFSSPFPSTHLYALLGPRGCGKTVMLNNVIERTGKKENWISVILNCKGDLLLQLAAALDEKVRSRLPKLTAEFSFSFSFLSVSLKGKEPVSDIHVLLRKMFGVLDKHGTKVLVAIDDVAINEYVEVFAKEFQILRGNHMPIFLVMTGLYSTFNKLENSEGLTFLLRTPKVYLGPLNEKAIASTYKTVLGISQEKAMKLAAFTKGYAFAYQCLGFLLVKHNKADLDEDVLEKLDYYLEEGVYNKLWDELSPKEKSIVRFIADKGEATNQELIGAGLTEGNNISNYKNSLRRKGVLATPARGIVSLALPRFGEFVNCL